MQKIITSALSIVTLFILTSCSNDEWKIVGKVYEFKNIAKNVYVIEGPLEGPNTDNEGFINNPGLIVGKDGLILIDVGGTYQTGKKVLKEVEKISKLPIKAIISTHIHGDHWLANQAILEKYPDVKIYASQTMISRMQEGDGDIWIVIMESATHGASQGTKVTHPTHVIKHKDKITIAGETFIVHAPFDKTHSNTDLMIQHPSSGVMFLSDNGFANRLGQFDNTSDMHNNIEALKYVKDLGEIFVPGHGSVGNYSQSVVPFLNYLQHIKKAGLDAYENDLQAFEIKDKVMQELHQQYGNWSRFEEVIGPHLIKMIAEIEERDF
jgi:glyoxylase-like metal-dependent hydrolase (beta-lactamase superfamily II)